MTIWDIFLRRITSAMISTARFNFDDMMIPPYVRFYLQKKMIYLSFQTERIYYVRGCNSTVKLVKMRTDYKKLWKLLIDHNMTKSELRLKAGISSVTLAKLGKGESVTTSVLLRICKVLNCNIGDIVDVVSR